MGGWGCPHESQGKCQRVNDIPCDIGMKGCVLFGRFRFADPSKNRPRKTPLAPVEPSAADNDSQQ
jgi:hypothetical protein